MKLILTVLSLAFVQADDLYWTDYDSGLGYDWSSLQQEQDYILETQTDLIYFNFGKFITKTCNGRAASAIRFSKSFDSCTILGYHDLLSIVPYSNSAATGLIFFYEGGEICRNNRYIDFKRRVEFRLDCKSYTSQFRLENSFEDCTTIIEKTGPEGCYATYEHSVWTKALFVFLYALIALAIIWVCYEALETDEYNESWNFAMALPRNKVLAFNNDKYVSV